ncbi:Uncharacterized protein APZ42_015241 [Daphnia magna]|uniref:Uncharacterized protein n=1 Tax=Daphnia magna TaxID=35525 RepID=A0A0P4XHR1_9CRUS|nr:Uncharacterized protein APZ42_015241 [Daphnia magna]
MLYWKNYCRQKLIACRPFIFGLHRRRLSSLVCQSILSFLGLYFSPLLTLWY